MRFKGVISTALVVSILGLPAFGSERYPTDPELQQLTQQLKQKIPTLQKSRIYQDRRQPQERQQVQSFVQAWSKVDPGAAPYLGMWTAIEESLSIYPSKIKGQVCVLETFLADQGLGVEFSTAIVSGGKVQTSKNNVLVKQGNFLGSAFVQEGKANIYEYAHPKPLRDPVTTDYLQSETEMIEQFKQAGCTTDLPKSR